jgi:uncharacterized membrane protein
MLAFCNGTRQDVWIAYMFYSPEDCGGEGRDWQAIGWFQVGPGQCRTVYENDLDDVSNRYWCYYAQNADASLVWAGPYPVYVSNAAFNHCIGEARTDWWIAGFRLFDVGDADDFTMNLVE